MKRWIIILLPLLFFILLPKNTVFAADSSMSATVTPMATNNYQLAYPGILPDNPLYIFKVTRDAIVAFFISDPLKKSAFYLLQSDKRVEASWYLVKEGSSKDSLAATTLAKSTNYLSMAIDQIGSAKNSSEDVSSEIGNIQDATQKHIAVVQGILQVNGLSNPKDFATELTRLQGLEKVVMQLSSH